jgi:diguanylate cyclase (GGDEF)-like protein
MTAIPSMTSVPLAPGASPVRPSPAAATDAVDIDRAVGLVRLLLAILGVSVLTTLRFADSGTGWLRLSIGVAVLAGSAGSWWLAGWLRSPGRRITRVAADIVLQVVDTAGLVVLVGLLSSAMPDVAWVALVVPVVIASLRFGPRGILVTWAAGVGGYLALLAADLSPPGRDGLRSAVVVQRPGALLAVAVAAAVLARWLQEGWLVQAELRAEASARSRRILNIESAGRAMRRLPAEQVLTTCLHFTIDLGHAAATISRDGSVDEAVGDGEVVPRCVLPGAPPAGQVQVTRWLGDDGRTVFSASVLESSSGAVVTAWDRDLIDDDRAQAFHDLVLHATTARDTATLLETLRRQATKDPLTGLANRRELDRELTAMSGRAEPLAVLLIDLDGFKGVNDTYGHAAGDDLLVQIARRIEGTIQGHGVVARYGGDEFVVLLRGAPALKVTAVADALLDDMLAPFALAATTLHAGFSIGVGFGDGPLDGVALQRCADDAVYDAKAAGRGVARFRRLLTERSGPPSAPPVAARTRVDAAVADPGDRRPPMRATT